MIKNFVTKQFLTFLFVGGFAAILHWLARIGLSIWLPFSAAVVIAYVFGMAIAFLLNRVLVFPNSQKAMHTQARDFIMINLLFFPLVCGASVCINYGLNSMGMINHSEELAHAMAISLPMLGTFLLYKFFAFKEKSV